MMVTPGTNPTRRPPVRVHPESRPQMTGPDPAEGPEPRLLVTLATYNEADNLRPLVEAIREQAPGASVLVIDDNSPDGTGAIADELSATLADIHVIHRAGKLGLGTAIIEGIEFAIAHGYDYLLNVDADFSHPPRYIPAILAGMRDHDVMIGSRYIPGGGFEGGQFDLKRKFMSTGINLYARLFLGLQSKDNSGAFRCYRVSKLAAIDVRRRVKSRGYSFMEEILFWCRQVGCRIGETPIVFENRRAGVSKINKYEAYMALRIIFELGVGRLLGTTRVEPVAAAAVPPAPHVTGGGGA
jgi:dolichol-phosphate mannosyltransferase